MLDELRLDNFQGFGEFQKVPLKPLTLIYGPNASGKSSIIRSLRLLNQSFEGRGQLGADTFAFEGPLISLASFENAVHRHDEELVMRIGVSLSHVASRSGLKRGLYGAIERVDLDWAIESPSRITGIEVTITPRRKLFLARIEGGLSERIKFVFTNGESGLELDSCEGLEWLSVFSQSGVALGSFDGAPIGAPETEAAFASNLDWEWQEVIDAGRFRLRGLLPEYDRLWGGSRISEDSPSLKPPSSQVALVSYLFDHIRMSLFVNSNGFQYIGPLREISKRVDFSAGSPGNNARIRRNIASGEEGGDAIVGEWLEKLTNGRFTLRTLEFQAEPVGFLGALKSETVIDNLTGTQVTFEDVGVGLSQVLPILRTLGDGRSTSLGGGSTVTIEQPELHLHPKMQSGLSDLFADLVSGRQNLQIIAETHSETFLMHIQKRLRSGTLEPDKVQVLFVDRGPDGNVITPIPLDPARDFEIDLPVSFTDLRLEEYL